MKDYKILESFSYGDWQGVVLGEDNFNKYKNKKKDYKVGGSLFIAHSLSTQDQPEKAPPPVFKEFFLHADKNWGKKKLEYTYSQRVTKAVQESLKLVKFFEAMVEEFGMDGAIKKAREQSVPINVKEDTPLREETP